MAHGIGVPRAHMTAAVASTSASEDDGVSGGTITGIVIGVLIALVLATVAIMWVRGTPIPCANDRNPHRVNQAIPMYSNPTYTPGSVELEVKKTRSRTASVA